MKRKPKRMKAWRGWMFRRWDGTLSDYVYRNRNQPFQPGDARTLRWFRVVVSEVQPRRGQRKVKRAK